MKRILMKSELRLLGRCYCAAPEGESGASISDDDVPGFALAVPSKAWAERMADRHARRTGRPWVVLKWAHA